MCYNCGCGMPDEDHGDPKNITTKTFEEAAKVTNMKTEDAKKFTKELLETETATAKKSN